MADQTARAAGHDWRDRVLTDPDMILDDRDLMRALIAANDRQMGCNIVDLRGAAMERLETRLDRLEDTHRTVVAAAYENLSGTNQIHRCVIGMLEADDLAGLLDQVQGDLASIVRVDRVRLALEGETAAPPHDLVARVPAGFVRGYVTRGHDVPLRQVTLRQCSHAAPELFAKDAGRIRSEALLHLDLGAGHPPAMLALGAQDPHQFGVNQGTELLTFFTAAFERLLARHIG